MLPPVGVHPPHTPPPITPDAPHDSPFSDYWTDASFSPNPDHPHCFESHPSQKPLLQRINSIGAHIVRSEPHGKLAELLSRKLDALEAVLAAPETRSRLPAHLEDSGLFMEDDDPSQWGADQLDLGSDKEETDIKSNGKDGDEKAQTSSDEEVSPQSINDSHKIEDVGLTQLITRITSTQESLRRRYDEVKHINDLVSEKLRRTTSELSALKEANASLVNTLELNGSELVFLNLQLQSLEQNIPSSTGASTDNSTKPDLTAAEAKEWRTEINRWKYNSHEVKQRFARRAAMHGVRAEHNSEPRLTKDVVLGDLDGIQGDDAGTATPRPELGQRAATVPLLNNSAEGNEDELPTQDEAPLPEPLLSVAGVDSRPMSAWGAFWESLAEAAGLIDYRRMFYEEH